MVFCFVFFFFPYLEQLVCIKDEEQQTSVEELLAFIEGGDGDDGDQPITSKLSKRQRKKLKKASGYLSHHLRYRFRSQHGATVLITLCIKRL